MTTTPTIWLAPRQANTSDSGPNGSEDTSFTIGLTGDRTLVVWEDDTDQFQLGAPDIRGQIFDPFGKTLGDEMLLNSFVDLGQVFPSAAARPDGGFVIAYETTDANGGNTGENIAVDQFEADGTPTFFPGYHGADAAADETRPILVSFADGSYDIFYESNSGAGKDIVGLAFDAAGTQGTAFTVSATASDDTAPAAAVVGSNVIVVSTTKPAHADPVLQVSVLKPDGTPVSATTLAGAVRGVDPAAQIAALTGGGAVVAFTADDAGGTGIQGALLDAAGSFVRSFSVNTKTAGNQDQAAITALGDGGFLVAWRDAGADDIRAQRFDAAAGTVGDEFVISADGDLSQPHLTLLDDRRVAVSYTRGVGGNNDIAFAIVDPRDKVIRATNRDDVVTSRIDGAEIDGLNGNDTLLGLDGADRLNGGSGADTMSGGKGNDVYVVDTKADKVVEAAGQGTDTVYAGVNWTLGSGQAVEYVRANAGATGLTLTGNALANRIYGGAGGDTLNGGGGRDVLLGGAGNDTYLIATTGVTVAESANSGRDQVRSSVSYTLTANVENLVLTGSGGIAGTGNTLANAITGNAAANLLKGGDGNDKLVGGLGADVLSGGAGRDTFSYGTSPDSSVTASDTITDFSGTDGDVIDLRVFGAGTTLAYSQFNSYGILKATNGGQTERFKLDGSFIARGFHTAVDSAGTGTAITYTPAAQNAAYFTVSHAG